MGIKFAQRDPKKTPELGDDAAIVVDRPSRGGSCCGGDDAEKSVATTTCGNRIGCIRGTRADCRGGCGGGVSINMDESPPGGKRIKVVRLFVVTLLVSLMFVCAYMTLPQLACLCQIDSNGETNQEAVENLSRVIQSNQQCSEKINRLSFELQDSYEIRKRLQESLDMGRSIYVMALKKLKELTEENRRLVLQLQSKASFKLLESNENEGEIHYQPYDLNNLRTTFTFDNTDDIEEDAPITIQQPTTEKVNKETIEQ